MEKLQTKYGHVFVEYRQHRIFFKQIKKDWFVIVYRTGTAATVGYPCIGSGWFPSEEAAIAAGKKWIDNDLERQKQNN